MTQRQLPLGDDLWPMEGHVRHRPLQTSCANCGRVVEQANAVRSATEDFCSKACLQVFTLSWGHT